MSHSASSTPAIVCRDLSFAWQDGTSVLEHLDVAFDTGRTGLIGLNGSGKSTLLSLISGALRPSSGTVSAEGDIGYLRQTLTLDVAATVSDLLGIAEKRAALRAIEAGDVSTDSLADLDDDWDVEQRAVAELDRLGFGEYAEPAELLDRTVGTLSGGEAVLVALAGIVLRRPAITLLDEPTNNLDRPTRQRLYAAVDRWQGVLIIVSHDRELLEHVDQIVELRAGTVRTYGGTFSKYLETLAAEQEAAQRMVRVAKADVRREQRELIEARTKLSRRERYAKNDFTNKRRPKIMMNQRKTEAEVSAGKHRIMQEGKLDDARDALESAQSAVRDDDRIRIELPGTHVPTGRDIVRIAGEETDLIVRGPERIALLGANGSGKTTLLQEIVRTDASSTKGIAEAQVPIGYLRQRLDIIDDKLSLMDNIRAVASHASPNDIRAGLARFLIRGDQVKMLASTLSGGERFRVSLACLLLADPPPQLLLLDEPTNNLDLASVTALTDALSAYRGALIVASHDVNFLAEIGITRWWTMDRGARPRETDAVFDGDSGR